MIANRFRNENISGTKGISSGRRGIYHKNYKMGLKTKRILDVMFLENIFW